MLLHDSTLLFKTENYSFHTNCFVGKKISFFSVEQFWIYSILEPNSSVIAHPHDKVDRLSDKYTQKWMHPFLVLPACVQLLLEETIPESADMSMNGSVVPARRKKVKLMAA